MSKVCRSFFALEEENRKLSEQLEDTRREYCYLSCKVLLCGLSC
jgi:hypothetical protein